MGETISTLVFRPPKPPTPIKKDRFFYLEIYPDFESCLTCGAVPATTKGGGSALGCGLDNNGLYRIPAFFIKRRGASITFLFSHGNAEDLGMMYGRMKEMARVLCVNILAYDYTGYGLSTGEPSEGMCYRNIEAAYKYLREERNIPPSQIVLYGRSLGSGPSCHLARKTALDGESVAGVILHSPFLSIYRIVMDFGFGLVGDMFRNKNNAKDIRCPVFIIHGTKDEVVPYWHGDELLRSVPPEYRARPFFVLGLGHNNIENKVREEYFRRIDSFLKKHVSSNKTIPEEQSAMNTKFVPKPIPQQDRYQPRTSLRDSGKFVFNQTWVKHGSEIVHTALQSKGFKNGEQISEDLNIANTGTHHPDMRSIRNPTSFTEPIEFGRTRTSSLLSKLRAERQDKYKWSGDDCSTSNASRFIETLESWGNTSTEVDDNFDTENITLVSRTESMSADPGLSFDNPYVWSASTMSESENIELKTKSLDG